MVEFNPDGSLKLPGQLGKKVEDEKNKLKTQRCIKVKRELLSSYAPKKCALHIIVSDAIKDKSFIINIFRDVNNRSQTPMKINTVSDNEFEIFINSDFKRCSDCNMIVNRYKEFLDHNVIDEKGTCTYEGRKNFYYEDYFD